MLLAILFAMSYQILAYYLFSPIADPQLEVTLHKVFLTACDASARIYISEEGINGQLCIHSDHAPRYIAWMNSRAPFEDLVFKATPYHEHAFPRLTVKYRKQLVAIDVPIDVKNAASHISPAEWRRRMEEEEGHLILDVRNHYEWEVGHFEGAISPECDTFREFDQYAEKLKEKYNPKTTPVMMCCTGGIRCELYSALLKERGFEQVYQLDGGIINYGLKEGSSHWLGKLFVFDDRLTAPISDEEAPIIGKCVHCAESSENYYNCANMDCNRLYLCCSDCLQKFDGCCGDVCKDSPRIRPFAHQNPHKPFRRWHHYFTEKPAV